MDVLKRMFQKGEDRRGQQKSENSDEIAEGDQNMTSKWLGDFDGMFDEGEKFSLQIFTDPIDLQKHLEEQMQQVIEAVSEFENKNSGFSKDKDFFRPNFDQEVWQEFDKQNKSTRDTDLDGEIFSDQLHSLIQRFAHSDIPSYQKKTDHSTAAEVPSKLLPRNNRGQRHFRSKPKLSDEDVIMGCIHGTLEDDGSNGAGWYRDSVKRSTPDTKSNLRADLLNPFGQVLPRSNSTSSLSSHEGSYPFTRFFSQSIVTKTIRKPDGTMETTRTVQDSKGNRTTSIIRSKDGKTERVTAYNDQHQEAFSTKGHNMPELKEYMSQIERNIYVSKKGYALPRNLY